MVPGAGIEPARRLAPKDFKSFASACSATQALFGYRKESVHLLAYYCEKLKNQNEVPQSLSGL